MYSMGKMGIVYMGNIDGKQEDQDSGSWSEEERLYRVFNSRERGNVRDESESIRNQPKRAYRENSQESAFVQSRSAVAGGMLGQLIQMIDDYRNQVATRKEDIKRFENEVTHLESKIEQFRLLVEDLKNRTEEV